MSEDDRALAAAMLSVRKELAALSVMHPETARSHLRRIKLRYHPDKAAPAQRDLFSELSKRINAETAGKFD